MTSLRTAACLWGTCLLLAPLARGEVTLLDSLAVSESADPNAVEMDTENRAEAVTIISGEELRGRSNSLNDIVNRVAGVKVRQTGGLGSSTKISIHGLEGKRIMILVDGSPIDSRDGNFGINDIPVDFIDHIEIYKGYVPARFGGDGMGGAINVVIREFNTNYLDGSYSLASHNTHRTTWLAKRNFYDIGKKGGIFEIGFGGFYNYSDNDYSFRSPYIDSLTITRDHDAYRSLVFAGAARLRHYWFDEAMVEVAYYNNEKEIQGIAYDIRKARTESETWLVSPKFEKNGLANGKLDIDYEVGLTHAIGRNIDTAYTRYQGWDSASFITSTRPQGETSDRPALSESHHKSINQSLNLDYRFSPKYSLNWNTGVGYTTYRNNDSLGSAIVGFDVGGYPGKLTTVVSGLSFESEWFDKRLVNLTGAKGYYFRSEVSPNVPTLKNEQVKSTSSHQGFGYDESFRLRLLDPLHFKAGYQHSLRLPDSDELFGNGITISTSPELGPEYADNFFAGFIFDSYSVPFLARVQYEINGFYMNISDMIKLQSAGSNGQAYYNLENIRIQGIDTELKIDWNEYIYGYTNLTLQDARNTEYIQSQGIKSGLTVPNIPRLFMNFGLELHTADLFYGSDFAKIFWNANYTDQYYFDWQISDKQPRTIPASFVQDAGIEYSIQNNKASWSAEIQNIADRQIYDEYNLPKPGRTFATKIRFSIID